MDEENQPNSLVFVCIPRVIDFSKKKSLLPLIKNLLWKSGIHLRNRDFPVHLQIKLALKLRTILGAAFAIRILVFLVNFLWSIEIPL